MSAGHEPFGGPGCTCAKRQTPEGTTPIVSRYCPEHRQLWTFNRSKMIEALKKFAGSARGLASMATVLEGIASGEQDITQAELIEALCLPVIRRLEEIETLFLGMDDE